MAQVEKAVYKYGDQINIDYTPVADVAAGDVLDLGTFVGVALRPIAAGETGALCITGVFDFLKGAGLTASMGNTILWDATRQVAYIGGSGYTDDAMAGVCVAAAAAGDATIRVLLNPFAHTAAG